MIDRARTMLAATALLALAGCGGPSTEHPANGSADAGNVVEAASNAAIATAANAQDDANAVAPANTLAPAASLSGYVGKHPSEKVDGTTFVENAAVTAAVAATVPDAKVRDFVAHYNGPDAPIVMKAGRVLAWGCEVHNCGYHNWSVSITPDGASADVCFYNNPDTDQAKSTWYLAGGRQEQRPGNCPSE